MFLYAVRYQSWFLPKIRCKCLRFFCRKNTKTYGKTNTFGGIWYARQIFSVIIILQIMQSLMPGVHLMMDMVLWCASTCAHVMTTTRSHCSKPFQMEHMMEVWFRAQMVIGQERQVQLRQDTLSHMRWRSNVSLKWMIRWLWQQIPALICRFMWNKALNWSFSLYPPRGESRNLPRGDFFWCGSVCRFNCHELEATSGGLIVAKQRTQGVWK